MDNTVGRFKYLFTTTKGLILLNIALISLTVAIFGTLSGPMKEWGIAAVTKTLLGMEMLPEDREGRIIMLYHTIAIGFLSLLVYIITDIVRMAEDKAKRIRNTITVGYILALFCGLGFAYWGRNWALHGLFLVGQALVFYAGILLTMALWPWSKDFYEPADSQYAHLKSGFPLERLAFWTMAMATLGSAIFGAVTGSYWGNGHETFLGENGVRHVTHSSLQLSIIGHLHIMLSLIGIATSLIVGRWYDFRGILHTIAMWLFIIGTVILTLGVWSVVPYQMTAHVIIYVGAVFSMSGALMLVIFGWRQLMGFGPGAVKEKVGFGVRIKRLLDDPLKFGSLWQMVFMNFTVSGVGIFMAIKLEAIFRYIPFREERITLVGHWHILSVLTGTIVLFYLMSEVFPVNKKMRKIYGWGVIIGSNLGFAMMTLFSLKRMFVMEENQEGWVTTFMILTDIGLGVTETILGVFVFLVLVKFFGKKLGGMAVIAGLVMLPQISEAVSKDTDPSTLNAELTISSDAWVTVPGGHFLASLNHHDINIPYDFDIMVTEVTNAQYVEYLNSAFSQKLVTVKDNTVMGHYVGDKFHGGRHEMKVFEGDYPYYDLNGQRARISFSNGEFTVKKGYEVYPATYVSWFGANAYALFHKSRLPLKLEWEKAARGTDGRSFPFTFTDGHHEPTKQMANYYHSKDPFDKMNATLPVGFYNGKTHGGFVTIDSPGPYGTYDQAGNVAEWTGDIVAGTDQRFIYGGSQMDYDFDLRVYTENISRPAYMSFAAGFRCVRDLNGPPPAIDTGGHH
ncbi:MAG: SUMF1/EgtB/PvdO family nonheme iron enzyme [Desulfocapsa sp.]|nr:SUMF1/EgtB/PvdO family nonheme iron enzyme [Desulfocapsa sp.]